MIFLMATTELDKVPKTVLSRCLQLNLKAVAQTQIANHMNTILDKEGIQYDPATTQLIAQSAQGSVRDGLTLLDQAIAFGAGKLETSQVKNCWAPLMMSIYLSWSSIFLRQWRGRTPLVTAYLRAAGRLPKSD